MKWLVTIFSTLLLSLFCSLSLSSSTYALSDITVTTTYDSVNGNSSSTELCSTNCADYNYLIVESSGTFPTSLNSTVSWSANKSGGQSIVSNNIRVAATTFIIYDLTSVKSLTDFYKIMGAFGASLSGAYDFTVTYTLTESISDCPVCPEPEEPEPCPVVPDNPYDTKLDNIVQAIYVCGAILLVIYFFYCIYRMIIHTTGGV